MSVPLESQQCGNCKFWKLEPEATVKATVEEKGKEPELVITIVGLCRESPPRQDSFTQSGFTRTREVTWCGHWKESSPELLAINKAARSKVIPEVAPKPVEAAPTQRSSNSPTSTAPAPAA